MSFFVGGIIALLLEEVERELVNRGRVLSATAAVIEGLISFSMDLSAGRSLLSMVNDDMVG